MQESTNSSEKTADSGTKSSTDVASIIPLLIQDLESDKGNI
ncbi:MAG: hypothetical protein EZS28_015640, partial [Streblomastix strix]